MAFVTFGDKDIVETRALGIPPSVASEGDGDLVKWQASQSCQVLNQILASSENRSRIKGSGTSRGEFFLLV